MRAGHGPYVETRYLCRLAKCETNSNTDENSCKEEMVRHCEPRVQQARFEDNLVGSVPLELLLHIVLYRPGRHCPKPERASLDVQIQFVLTVAAWSGVETMALYFFLFRYRRHPFLRQNTCTRRPRMQLPRTRVTYFRWQHGLKYGKPAKKIFLAKPEGSTRPVWRLYSIRGGCTFPYNARTRTGGYRDWGESDLGRT